MKTGRPRKDQAQGLPKRVYLRSGTFYYVHHDGKWEGLGKDLANARKSADAYNAGASTFGTMGHWLDEWVRHELPARVAAGTLSARTNSDYVDAIVLLKAFFGQMTPSSIEPHHVAEYLKIGRETERPVRANREKSALSSCMSWMLEHNKGGIKVNPCWAVSRNAEKPRDRYISDAEYHSVIDHCGPAEKAWAEMIYLTLQRPTDILSWTKKTIVNEGLDSYLQFRQSKTQRHMKIRMTPLLSSALNELAQQRKGVSTLYLIPREDGLPYTESGLASMFRRATVLAGAVDFAPYDLKAKGATDMRERGTSIEDICDLCGHDNTKTTEIYIKRHTRQIVSPNEMLPKRISATP